MLNHQQPDRDQEDLHGDEEAPARNVRNPKDTLTEERVTLQERTITVPGLLSRMRAGQRRGGPA